MFTSTLPLNAERALKVLNEELEKVNLEGSPSELYDPIRYILAVGGKRIRPLLVMLSNQLFVDDISASVTPAIGVELFHNFTLVHDDIMDNAPLRRGKPTIHEKWSSNTAILSGDVMVVKAYEQFLGIDKELLAEVLKRFSTTACEVCEGQQLDMLYETKEDVTVEEYISMIRLKTAVLLGFSLELGARLAYASEEQVKLLNEFGVALGIAFQLMDDLLDVYGDKEKFGKTVGGDIIANKKTYLLITALANAKGKDAKDLDLWLNAKNFEPADKVKAVTEIYNRLEVRKYTEERVAEYFSIAQKKFEKVDAPLMRKKIIKDMIDSLAERQK